MFYKKPLTEILDTVIGAMTFPFTFVDFTVNDDGTFTLNGINDFQHLQVGYPLPINVNDSLDDVIYDIKSIDEDEKTLTLIGDLPQQVIDDNLLPPAQQAYRVYFRHGTPKETSEELNKDPLNVYKDTPLIWLLEDFTETFFDDPEWNVQRESKIRLFFLADADHSGTVNMITNSAMVPMSRLLQKFIYQIENTPKIFDSKTDDGDIIEYSTTQHTKFGIYITNKGADRQILTGTFTGVELQITLRLFKTGECCTSDLSCNPANPCICSPKNIIKTVEDKITAYPGVSQTRARILTACINIVDTVANENDSCKMDKAVFGKIKTVTNYGASDMYLFPLEGDQIRYGSDAPLNIDVPIIIEVNNSFTFVCYEDRIWRYNN